MKNLSIKMTSVTYALKAKKVLQSYNFSSYIQRNPKPKEKEGCGYKLIITNPSKETLKILQNNHIPFTETEWTT